MLAKLPVVSPEKLHPLPLGSAQALACQCGGKELDRLMTQRIAIHNRWLAMDRFAWPGVESVFGEAPSPLARWFREGWYDPQRVIAAGAPAVRRAWEEACLEDTGGAEREDWAEAVVAIAQQVLALDGAEAQFLDYAYLQAEVTREQALLSTLEARHHRLQFKTVRPLYRQLHPSRNLETLKGVGQDAAAVYIRFIGDARRFSDHASFRGWTGMIPNSSQSGASEGKGLHLSQAGPNLIKKYAFLDAETARQRDPQIASIYYQ